MFKQWMQAVPLVNESVWEIWIFCDDYLVFILKNRKLTSKKAKKREKSGGSPKKCWKSTFDRGKSVELMKILGPTKVPNAIYGSVLTALTVEQWCDVLEVDFAWKSVFSVFFLDSSSSRRDHGTLKQTFRRAQLNRSDLTSQTGHRSVIPAVTGLSLFCQDLWIFRRVVASQK